MPLPDAVPITQADLFRYRLPLKRPLTMASGTYTEREGILLRLRTADGAEGWGEAAPLPGYSPLSLEAATRYAKACLFDFASSFHVDGFAVAPRNGLGTQALFSTGSPLRGPVRTAFEQAGLDLVAGVRGMPLQDVYARRFASAEAVPEVPINALLLDTSQPTAEAVRLQTEGYLAIKMKVGRRAPEADARSVRALAESLQPGVALRLDANRAWSFRDAARFAEALGDVSLEYVEEPLADPLRLPELKARTGLPYALDESLSDPDLPPSPKHLTTGPLLTGEGLHAFHFWDRELRAEAAALVVKPMMLGGFSRTLLNPRTRAPLVTSGLFESGVGTRHLVALAAALAGGSQGNVPAGLTPYRWLAADVLERPLPLQGPVADVAEALAPNPVRLQALKRVDV